MPTEILGLPLHPLAVHVPVVLVPLFALLAIAYTCVPRVRNHTSWLLFIFAIITPIAAAMAAFSGDPLAMQRLNALAENSEIAEQTQASISTHAFFGGYTMWTSILLGILSLVFLFLVRRERKAATVHTETDGPDDETTTAKKPRKIGQIILTVFIVLLSCVAFFLVINAGHTGAEMVWGA